MNRNLLLCAAALCLVTLSASARPVIGLTDNNELVQFDSASPGTIVSTVPIRGLVGAEKVESIDIRPHDGLLYGLIVSANPNLGSAVVTLSTINPVTGVATRVGMSAIGSDPAPLRYGFDFDPVNDLLRVVNSADSNRRVDHRNGQTNASDSNLAAPGDERITAVAYDRNDSSAATPTTLYGINFDTDQLVRIGGVNGTPAPSNGVVTSIGPLGVQTNSLEMGFDIAQDGTAYASLNDNGAFGLYTVNLSTGAATLVGPIGNGAKVIRGLTVPFDSALPALTFTVLNINPEGANSLREAIARSNAHPGLDTITFSIPGTGPHVITLSAGSGLPDVRDVAIIDGASEPSFDPVTRQPVVVISQTFFLGNVSITNGLAVTGEFANGSQIRSLRITSFVDNGNQSAAIRVNSDDVVVTGNYIGTDGTVGASNSNGVYVTGANCVIGGTSPSDRNLISFSMQANILLDGDNPQVLGNYIGTNAAGTGALSAGGVGILVSGNSAGAIIGGTATGSRNIISGDFRGLSLNGTLVVVAGNYIGTNAVGDGAIPNGIGVLVNQGGGHTIGVAGEGRNVISGNSSNGVVLQGSTQGNVLRNNFIGLNAAGSQLGNGAAGVRLAGGAKLNSIGQSGAGNVIAFNGAAGVAVEGSDTFANSINGNSMFSNGGLGIDLGSNGISPNDNGDFDAGPNGLQNFPLLTAAANKGNGTIVVDGTLNSVPNATYRIELYTTDAVDPSGNGEGRTSLGSFNAAADGAGNLTFSQTFPIAAGGFVTATAEAAGSTSEFSPAIPIAGPKPGLLANISTRVRVETDDKVLIGGIIISGMQPKKVMLRAIGPSLAGPGALPDPQMEVYNSEGQLIAANNNWRDNANQQEISDSTIAPSNDLESAFLGSLTPGAYTAVVSGVNGSTGVGLVEAYDLDQAANSKLANIATRGLVQTGDDVLIGGLIVTGDTPLKALVRGIAPSLDVNGKLADPTLELFDANGDSLVFNNNWRENQEAEIEATTIPPSNDLEAAIVALLPPANYTAVLRGLNDSTGIAVVEVYALSQ